VHTSHLRTNSTRLSTNNDRQQPSNQVKVVSDVKNQSGQAMNQWLQLVLQPMDLPSFCRVERPSEMTNLADEKMHS